MAAECLRASTVALTSCSLTDPVSARTSRQSAVTSFTFRCSKAQLGSAASNALAGLALPSTSTAGRTRPAAGRASGPVRVRAAGESKSVLIVNTNSGGHAVIGFWLAKQLRTWPRGHSVTIMTVGKEDDSKMKKPPFSRFDELRLEGVRTVWGDPSDVAAAVGSATFDVVVDNNGKDLASVQPVISWAKSRGAKQFLFVSSAGIYKNTEEPPHVEGDAVKADAGHVGVEEHLAATWPQQNWASFRPQYITGSLNNKDCEEWFFDRIARGRPVPIPAPGMQMTVIAPVYDMASMIVAAIENPQAAAAGIFNCVSDRCVTFDGLVRMCARAAGQQAEIVHYDPAAVGVDVKKAFPFRNQHFYSEPRAAKEKLGWKPQHDLQDVLNSRFEDYVASGRDKSAISFDLDDKILSAVKVPARVY